MRYGRALLALVSGLAAHAGVCPHIDGPRSDFELFAGYSPVSPTLIGTATDRRFVFAGLDYSYLCTDWKHVSLSFTAGLMPAAIVLQPTTFVAPSHDVYGFGITPVGVTFDFMRRRAVHPF